MTLSLLVSLWVLAAAPCSTSRVGDAVTSPDGKVTVFVTRDTSRTDDTALGDVAHEDLCISRGGGAPTVLVAGRGGPKPERTLASFESLVFSPDGATLFFITTGWVTSPAAHSVEVATGKEAFLFDGAINRPIEKGLYLAAHYRLDVEHPVTSPDYRGRMETWTLVTRTGKLVRKVSDAEAQKWLH